MDYFEADRAIDSIAESPHFPLIVVAAVLLLMTRRTIDQ